MSFACIHISSTSSIDGRMIMIQLHDVAKETREQRIFHNRINILTWLLFTEFPHRFPQYVSFTCSSGFRAHLHAITEDGPRPIDIGKSLSQSLLAMMVEHMSYRNILLMTITMYSGRCLRRCLQDSCCPHRASQASDPESGM